MTLGIGLALLAYPVGPGCCPGNCRTGAGENSASLLSR